VCAGRRRPALTYPRCSMDGEVTAGPGARHWEGFRLACLDSAGGARCSTRGPIPWAGLAASSENRPTPSISRSRPGLSWNPLGPLGRFLEHRRRQGRNEIRSSIQENLPRERDRFQWGRMPQAVTARAACLVASGNGALGTRWPGRRRPADEGSAMDDLCVGLGVSWTDQSGLPAHQAEAVDLLWHAYGKDAYGKVKFTVPALPVPSEIVRNDVIFLSGGGINRAWAERVYVALSDRGARPEVQGFVHVRTKGMLDVLSSLVDPVHPVPPLIEAYLACPPSIRPQSGRGHVVEDDLAAYLYGDPYTECNVTPYCRPHRQFAGVCAHAATHMCLVLSSKRHGGHALGTFDIHRLACAGEGPFAQRTFGIRGLSPGDVASVFASSRAGLSAIYEIRAVRDSYTGPPAACRSYLYSRNAIGQSLLGLVGSDCPVVLAVDNDTWSRAADQPPRSIGDLGPGLRGVKHGIVVVGYRVEPSGRITLIVHDSAVSAFVTAELHSVLEAAEAFDLGGKHMTDGHPNRIHYVASAPKQARLSPIHAGLVAWAEAEPPVMSARELDKFLSSADYRLIHMTDVEHAISVAMGQPSVKLAGAHDAVSQLADEGVEYVWRVSAAGSKTTTFVDATHGIVSSDDAALAEPGHYLGFAIIVDMRGDIGVKYPGDRGSDWWHVSDSEAV